MKVAVFSTKPYDRLSLQRAAENSLHELEFFEPRLGLQTVPLAQGYSAVCAFVNDTLDAQVLEHLAASGVRLIALRCAGFNNVDLEAAQRLSVRVGHVPTYSPRAVAEHTVGLMLSLNRKFHKAYNRIREGNFSLDGLLGFDLFGRTVGIIGTGQIGSATAEILHGFGCQLLLYDVQENPACQRLGTYVPLADVFRDAHILTLHCPLVPPTYHIIDAKALGQMRDGVMLINTSRGALVDTQAVIKALKTGRIGYLGLDVYEEEADLFFEDLSARVIQDDVFSRLLTFPNVLITGHQAFFTRNALEQIADVTMANLTAMEQHGRPQHEVTPRKIRK